MKRSAALLACACLNVLPLHSGFAGSEVTAPAMGKAAAASEFETYLQSRKINHSIDISDEKNAPQGPVMVKIYGDLGGSQQDVICAGLSAVAKRTRTATSTVQFYALEQSAAMLSFQPSRLPSGNGDVSFNRNASAPVYRLKRTARL